MRHTRQEDIENIKFMHGRLKSITELREKNPGSFYFKGKNIIHFHEDNGIYFCDIGGERLEVLESNANMIENMVRKNIDSLKKQ